MKKITLVVLLAIIIATVLIAPVFAADKLRVALVMPSTINDYAFSQSMYEAIKSLEEEYNIELSYSESMFIVPDAAAAMRDYAETNDIVIAHGSQYGTSVQEIAAEFPEVVFAWGTNIETFGLPNVYAYNPSAEEAGYVFGVLAANLTETGKIGVCGPVEAGDAKTYVDGFLAGVLATDPAVNVSVTYTSSFSDINLMAEAARTHMSEGADILTGTSQSVTGAIAVAKEQGGRWLGAQWDIAPVAPEAVIGSFVYDWAPVLRKIFDNRTAGILGGEAFILTLDSETLRIIWSEMTDGTAYDPIVAPVIDSIISGEIKPLK